MRHCLVHLILLFPFVWTDEPASSDLDLDASADMYYPDDGGLLTSADTTGWYGGDGGWSTDSEFNPDLFLDATSNKECQSNTDQLQMTTSRRLRRRDLCPNNLFQTSPSSHDAASRKFLESLPTFTMYPYKEPDSNICPEDIFGYFIYPICGFSEEEQGADGINIYPCSPCTLSFTELKERNVRE